MGPEPANLPFYAAHVGNDGAGRQVRCDFKGERHDLIHGCTNDDELRITNGIRRCVCHLIAPRLSF